MPKTHRILADGYSECGLPSAQLQSEREQLTPSCLHCCAAIERKRLRLDSQRECVQCRLTVSRTRTNLAGWCRVTTTVWGDNIGGWMQIDSWFCPDHHNAAGEFTTTLRNVVRQAVTRLESSARRR